MCTEQYTVEELKQLKCACCNRPATQQWKVCADDSWIPLCVSCDVVLNGIVLVFIGDPLCVAKMVMYQEKMINES